MPNNQLTLRAAYERFYRSKSHRPRTTEAMREALTKWESVTVDPPIAAIDNALLFEAQQALLEELKATTVNKHFRAIQAILNRLGPRSYRNKHALAILPEAPCVMPALEDPRDPKVAELAGLSSIYQACDRAQWPICDVPPADWWRALLVFLYNVGPRRNDFLSLQWESVNLFAATVRFKAEKTRKSQTKPLNSVVVAHLEKIVGDRDLVFPSGSRRQLYKTWYAIQAAAGMKAPYYWFHEIRKTCGTKIYERSPGAAQEMLGHSSVETTRRSYANMTRNLVEVAQSLEQPVAFLADIPPTDPQPLRIVG